MEAAGCSSIGMVSSLGPHNSSGWKNLGGRGSQGGCPWQPARHDRQ
jgi:hypothetical protein